MPSQRNYVADELDGLGLYATANDVRRGHTSREDAIEHVWYEIEHGNRTAEWKRRATGRVEDLEDLR